MAETDLISRQAAIDALGEEPPVWYDGDDEIAERNQWRRDKAAIESLPSAEPKTGKWNNRSSDGTWATVDFAYCSECKQPIIHKHASPLWRFCPNCGSFNGGEEE
jgi:hypothetical protein